MKKTVLLSFFVIILFSIGCNDESKEIISNNTTVLTINLEKYSENATDFYNLLDSIKITPLKDERIRGISKIIAHDSLFYILDKGQNTIFIFDREGNLKYDICKKGKSREEYLEITDIDVGESIIKVYDQMSSKTIDYDIHTGAYIKTDHLSDRFSNIALCENTLCAYNSFGSGNSTNKMLTLFKNEKEIGNYINVPKFIDEKINIEQNMSFSHYETKLYLKTLFSNIIYNIEDDSVNMAYYIDFMNHTMPLKYLKKNEYDGANNLLSKMYGSKYAHSVEYFMETNNYIYFIFSYLNDDYSVYYNKNSNESSIYKKILFDEENKIWATNNHIANTNNSFISQIYLPNVFTYFSDDTKPKNNHYSKHLFDIAKETEGKYEFALMEYTIK